MGEGALNETAAKQNKNNKQNNDIMSTQMIENWAARHPPEGGGEGGIRG